MQTNIHSNTKGDGQTQREGSEKEAERNGEINKEGERQRGTALVHV